MEIIRRGQAIAHEKPEGTNVVYYIFPEYEIHYNEMHGDSIQQWHHHNVIEETIYIISGEVAFHWIEDGNERSQTLYAGDIVRVENEPHTLENPSKLPATFITVRLVLTGKDNRSLFRNDKALDKID